MSDEEAETKNFEQLLRWIFDEPLHQRPELGKPPSYIFEESKISLGTSSRLHRAIEHIRIDKPQAINAIKEYFEVFVENLKEFDIESDALTTDVVIESIEKTVPIRDEVFELIEVIARYSSNINFYTAIHNFFESLIPYLEPSRNKRIKAHKHLEQVYR